MITNKIDMYIDKLIDNFYFEYVKNNDRFKKIIKGNVFSLTNEFIINFQ